MSSLESQEREIHNVLFDVAKVDSQNPLGPTLSQLALKHQLLLSQSSQESDIIVKAFGVTCSQELKLAKSQLLTKDAKPRQPKRNPSASACDSCKTQHQSTLPNHFTTKKSSGLTQNGLNSQKASQLQNQVSIKDVLSPEESLKCAETLKSLGRSLSPEIEDLFLNFYDKNSPDDILLNNFADAFQRTQANGAASTSTLPNEFIPITAPPQKPETSCPRPEALKVIYEEKSSDSISSIEVSSTESPHSSSSSSIHLSDYEQKIEIDNNNQTRQPREHQPSTSSYTTIDSDLFHSEGSNSSNKQKKRRGRQPASYNKDKSHQERKCNNSRRYREREKQKELKIIEETKKCEAELRSLNDEIEKTARNQNYCDMIQQNNEKMSEFVQKLKDKFGR